LLTSTLALLPTALTILPARVLNAPHCLQASMLTIIPLLEETFALDVVSFLVIFFFAGGFFAALGVTVLLERERVVLAMVAYDLRNRSDVSFQSDIHPRGATEESESVDLDFFDFFHSNTVSVRKYVRTNCL